MSINKKILAAVFTAISLPMLLLFSLAPVSVRAHQSALASPEGRSPWISTEKWYMTNWYGEGGHVDYYGGSHYNDYYALDFARSGNSCNQPLYGFWKKQRVTKVDSGSGFIQMQHTVGGTEYRAEYRHLNSIAAKVGQIVTDGDRVGYTGNKGISSGCHVHVSIRKLGSDGRTWYSMKPHFCGRTYPHDHSTAFSGCRYADF